MASSHFSLGICFVIVTSLINVTGAKESSSSVATDCKQPLTCILEGYYGDPNDCRKFYTCERQGSNGLFTINHFNCLDGLWYDPSYLYCNYPDLIRPYPSCASCTT